MNLQQVIKEEQRARQNIYSIFKKTCDNRLPLSEYLHMKKELKFHPNLPRHSQATLQGYSSALFEFIQIEKVYWGFMFKSLISDYGELPEDGKQLVREGKIEGHLYWKDTNNMETSDIWS